MSKVLILCVHTKEWTNTHRNVASGSSELQCSLLKSPINVVFVSHATPRHAMQPPCAPYQDGPSPSIQPAHHHNGNEARPPAVQHETAFLLLPFRRSNRGKSDAWPTAGEAPLHDFCMLARTVRLHAGPEYISEPLPIFTAEPIGGWSLHRAARIDGVASCDGARDAVERFDESRV